MDISYWYKQTATEPLFPDVEWQRPERRDQAGKLGIIGGNKLGFAAVADSYQVARELGAGRVRALLPDCLKSAIPNSLTDVMFAACNQSGSLKQEAGPELAALGAWCDGLLLIGDAGRSSETAVVYETFLQRYDGPLTITRDAIDLVRNNPTLLAERADTVLVVSFAQLQKIFHGVYYPKMLTFSMQLLQLVEALHKFTTTYPCTIVTLHHDTLVIAHEGNVVTQAWENPMAIWRGTLATKIAVWRLWHRSNSLEAAAQSIL